MQREFEITNLTTLAQALVRQEKRKSLQNRRRALGASVLLIAGAAAAVTAFDDNFDKNNIQLPLTTTEFQNADLDHSSKYDYSQFTRQKLESVISFMSSSDLPLFRETGAKFENQLENQVAFFTNEQSEDAIALRIGLFAGWPALNQTFYRMEILAHNGTVLQPSEEVIAFEIAVKVLTLETLENARTVYGSEYPLTISQTENSTRTELLSQLPLGMQKRILAQTVIFSRD